MLLLLVTHVYGKFSSKKRFTSLVLLTTFHANLFSLFLKWVAFKRELEEIKKAEQKVRNGIVSSRRL